LLQARRYGEAAVMAHEAVRRAPNSLAANVLHAQAAYAQLTGSGELQRNASAAAHLFQLVEAIQQAAPREPATFPIYVALTASTSGTDAARALAEEALKASPPLPDASLLTLTAVSDEHGLNLTDSVMQVAE